MFGVQPGVVERQPAGQNELDIVQSCYCCDLRSRKFGQGMEVEIVDRMADCVYHCLDNVVSRLSDVK